MKFYTLLLCWCIIMSCSSDDSSNSSNNGFTVAGTFYEVKTLYINDENTSNSTAGDIGFLMVNKNADQFNSGNDLSNLNVLYFDFSAVEVEETTYTNISDYSGRLNATITDGVIGGGIEFLSDNSGETGAGDISVQINSITDNTVDLSFSFTRIDGEIIAGTYKGEYNTLD